jgi:hypothetical protein
MIRYCTINFTSPRRHFRGPDGAAKLRCAQRSFVQNSQGSNGTRVNAVWPTGCKVLQPCRRRNCGPARHRPIFAAHHEAPGAFSYRPLRHSRRVAHHLLPRLCDCGRIPISRQTIHPKGAVSAQNRVFATWTLSDIALERGGRSARQATAPALRHRHHDGRWLARGLFPRACR